MRYTLELNVKAVESAVKDVRNGTERPREVIDVARVVFSGDSLDKVVKQAKGHLDLIWEGTQV